MTAKVVKTLNFGLYYLIDFTANSAKLRDLFCWWHRLGGLWS